VRLRVGVVGGGLVAQAMHIPNLHQLDERFELAALAEPSQTVRERLARRYGIPSTYADYRALLEQELDAVVVCSPNATHAAVVLTALDAGLHVFVEKPLCITIADADAIVAARDAAGKVVQVGYMKRFDPAVERLYSELPSAPGELRYVRVVVNDPEFVPYFGPEDIVRGDVPAEFVAETRRLEREQLEEAVGRADPEVVVAFSEGYLGSLVHDVNLVHGALEQLGLRIPAPVANSAWWAGGRALTGSVQLPDGVRWDSAWIQLMDLREYRESVAIFFADSIRTLEFPSPWLRQSPTRYERSGADGVARVATSFESPEEAFVRELVHFHDCITSGARCRTPPEQARVDIAVLTDMFLAAA
jgi:GFO/IDH/MocA oxidoreductase family protein